MRPSGLVYRIARKPRPWSPLDWSAAGPNGTFDNRYDDPGGTYRVLYASSEITGCYLETLARFRVDPALIAELQEITGDDDFNPVGVVPREWFSIRTIGTAELFGDYADVCSSEWVAKLRLRLAGRLHEFGFEELDTSTLQASAPREFTQLVSRLIFETGVDGIYYRSKYGHDIENWAIFEPFKLKIGPNKELRLRDTELLRALAIHRLTIAPARRQSRMP